MSKEKYIVSGNTFAYKDKIKKAGGKYNGDGTWTVSLYKSDSLLSYRDRLVFTEISDAELTRAQKERQHDALYNEGGDGFNPYRAEYHSILQEIDDVD